MKPAHIAAGAAALACVAVAGNFHVLHGGAGPLRVIEKASWGLSETFVNAGELEGMPAMFARARYPLTLARLAVMAREVGAEPDLSDSKLSRVQIGMSKADVASAMGGWPQERREDLHNERETWIYRAPIDGRMIHMTFAYGKLYDVQK